jgi:CheY-like chemotaxis protein
MSAGSEVRVLVVDDNVDIQDALTLALEEEGVEVACASNGREALQALERGLPDLIVTDIKMPVMNGHEFARDARERFGAKLPPIIVLTAADNAAARAAEVGAQGWLAKPFDLQTFRSEVEKHLGSAAHRGAAPLQPGPASASEAAEH